MELLTDKAKKDFWDWYIHPDNTMLLKVSGFTTKRDGAMAKLNWIAKCDIERMAIIQEWFDSVGMCFNVSSTMYTTSKKGEFHSDLGNGLFNTRQEALKESIIVANEIYNESN